MFRKIGFTEIEFVGETGFNSSPVTRGALFRATKPLISIVKEEGRGEDTLASPTEEKSSKGQAEGKEDLSAEQACST